LLKIDEGQQKIKIGVGQVFLPSQTVTKQANHNVLESKIKYYFGLGNTVDNHVQFSDFYKRYLKTEHDNIYCFCPESGQGLYNNI